MLRRASGSRRVSLRTSTIAAGSRAASRPASWPGVAVELRRPRSPSSSLRASRRARSSASNSHPGLLRLDRELDRDPAGSPIWSDARSRSASPRVHARRHPAQRASSQTRARAGTVVSAFGSTSIREAVAASPSPRAVERGDDQPGGGAPARRGGPPAAWSPRGRPDLEARPAGASVPPGRAPRRPAGRRAPARWSGRCAARGSPRSRASHSGARTEPVRVDAGRAHGVGQAHAVAVATLEHATGRAPR